MDTLENILEQDDKYIKYNNNISITDTLLYFIYLDLDLKDILCKDTLNENMLNIFKNKIILKMNKAILDNNNCIIILYNYIDPIIHNKIDIYNNIDLLKNHFNIQNKLILSCCESHINNNLLKNIKNNNILINNIDWQLYNCIYRSTKNNIFDKDIKNNNYKRFIFLNRRYTIERYILLYNIYTYNIQKYFHLSFLSGEWQKNGKIVSNIEMCNSIYTYIKKNNININYNNNIYTCIKKDLPIILDSDVDKCDWTITFSNIKINNIFSTGCIYIATESIINNNYLYISEKTYKSLYYKTPFIIYGSKHMLVYLKSIGFKTFHPYINEDYDNESNDNNRLNKIIYEINRLSNLSDIDFINLYNKIQIIANENYNILINLKKSINL